MLLCKKDLHLRAMQSRVMLREPISVARIALRGLATGWLGGILRGWGDPAVVRGGGNSAGGGSNSAGDGGG